MTNGNFSEQLKHYRKQLGLSQNGLSEKTGIPKRNIENWEEGRNKCPAWVQNMIIEKIQRLSEETGNGIRKR